MKKALITAPLFLVLLCYAIGSKCQMITGAEYFINADPGVGNGVPIVFIGLSNVDVNLTIPATGLPAGFNQLFIRVKDQSSNWSIAERRSFYVDSTLHTLLPGITAAEYFFDIDPGTGNARPFPIQSNTSVNAFLNTSTLGLSDGFHQLFIRMKDQYDNWSIAEQRTFYIDNNLHALVPGITASEYFFDTDPGAGNANLLSIQLNDSISAIIDINTAALAGGFHQLFIRIRNEYNKWSIAEQRTFYIDSSLHNPIPLIAAAYFIDADNGVDNGIPFTITRADSVNLSYPFITSNIPLGKHIMSIRLQDSSKRWSIAESRPFTVCTTYGAVSDFGISVSGSSVSFVNNSLYATSYHWIFGDGDTSNVMSPVHTYNPGSYTACLISKNDCNITGDTLCISITVNVILPVSLANIRLNCMNNKVLITWQALSETNSTTFEIQRSVDGLKRWNMIGLLNTRNDSDTINHYQFVDDYGSVAFYRLRMINKDGKYIYSEVLKSNCPVSSTYLHVYPIPSRDIVNIVINSPKEDHATISLVDISGKLIRQVNRSIRTGTNMFTINTSAVSSGEYFLKVKGAMFLNTQKIIIMH